MIVENASQMIFEVEKYHFDMKHFIFIISSRAYMIDWEASFHYFQEPPMLDADITR